jgi:hypothetical protein
MKSSTISRVKAARFEADLERDIIETLREGDRLRRLAKRIRKGIKTRKGREEE